MDEHAGWPRRRFLGTCVGLGTVGGLGTTLAEGAPAPEAAPAPPPARPSHAPVGSPQNEIPLHELVADDFLPLIGRVFRLHAGADGGFMNVQLVEVRESLSHKPQARARAIAAGFRPPFTLRFQSKSRLIFPQQIYDLSQPGLGRFSLFLVPGNEGKGPTTYTATFN